jgi:hypothetical protein
MLTQAAGIRGCNHTGTLSPNVIVEDFVHKDNLHNSCWSLGKYRVSFPYTKERIYTTDQSG